MGAKKNLPGRDKGEGERRPFLSGIGIIRFLCVLVLVLNLLVLWGIFFSSQGLWGYRLKSRQVKEMEEGVTALQKANQKFYRRIMNFKNDARAQERLAREQLGWARENELMIQFMSPGKPQGSPGRESGLPPNTP